MSTGGMQTGRALLAAVQPTFMLPAVALSAAGSALAPAVSVPLAVVHAMAVGAALYTAHVVDEYVDAHVRGEDDASLSEPVTKYAAAASSVAFAVLAAALWGAGARAAVAATAPLWVLAVLHAPVLDSHPVTVTVDYPVGVALAFVGGFLAQVGRLAAGVLAVAVVLAVSLSALKVSIDRLDREFDRTIDKRTLPVLLGDRRSAVVAAVIHVLVAVLVVAFAVASALPRAAVVAAAVPVADAVIAASASRRVAVRLQMALAYPFTAALLAAQCAASDCAAVSFANAVGVVV